MQVLETADSGDEKAITAMGLLNTMETILGVMEERAEVHAALEPVVLQVNNDYVVQLYTIRWQVYRVHSNLYGSFFGGFALL